MLSTVRTLLKPSQSHTLQSLKNLPPRPSQLGVQSSLIYSVTTGEYLFSNSAGGVTCWFVKCMTRDALHFCVSLSVAHLDTLHWSAQWHFLHAVECVWSGPPCRCLCMYLCVGCTHISVNTPATLCCLQNLISQLCSLPGNICFLCICVCVRRRWSCMRTVCTRAAGSGVSCLLALAPVPWVAPLSHHASSSSDVLEMRS